MLLCPAEAWAFSPSAGWPMRNDADGMEGCLGTVSNERSCCNAAATLCFQIFQSFYWNECILQALSPTNSS
eukprot:symbB.v1.2.007960.t1/scaffold478.1/size396144/11